MVTILNYDPFGYDYMMYTVKNKCVEVPDLQYGDGLQFIYFYTKGTKGGSDEIRRMLQFIQDSREVNVTDESTKALYDYVSKVKIQPEARLEYMKFDEWLAWEKQDVMEATMRNAIFELLEDHGEIPDELKKRIEAEYSMDVLKKWHKLAAKAVSIQDFMDKME